MALAAPHARNDAEGAVVVAALDDAHVVTYAGAPSGRHRLPFRVVVPSRQAGEEVVVLADGHHGIELGKSAPEVIPLLGHDAARDRDRPLGRLPRPQLVQLRVDPILRGLADDAGVEDRYVRAV